MSPDTGPTLPAPPFKTCPGCGFGPERHSAIGNGDWLCHAGLDTRALAARAQDTAPKPLEVRNAKLWLNGRVVGSIRNFSVGTGDLPWDPITISSGDNEPQVKSVRPPNRKERRAAASFDRRQARKSKG